MMGTDSKEVNIVCKVSNENKEGIICYGTFLIQETIQTVHSGIAFRSLL